MSTAASCSREFDACTACTALHSMGVWATLVFAQLHSNLIMVHAQSGGTCLSVCCRAEDITGGWWGPPFGMLRSRIGVWSRSCECPRRDKQRRVQAIVEQRRPSSSLASSMLCAPWIRCPGAHFTGSLRRSTSSGACISWCCDTAKVS